MSVLKVVATIEMPISHHGAARPDVKNSVVLGLARLHEEDRGQERDDDRREDDREVERGEVHRRLRGGRAVSACRS